MYEPEDEAPAVVDVPPPNATVTARALAAAVKDGTWAHDDPSTQLWLNTTFSPGAHTVDTLRFVLAVHGVAVSR